MKNPKAFDTVNDIKSYWGGNGKHQAKADLLQKLIPTSGAVTPPALDSFRRAGNAYYDLYNNGLCNRADEFRQVFGFGGTTADAARIEARTDALVLAAWDEQEPTTLAAAEDAVQGWALDMGYRSKYDPKRKAAPKKEAAAFRAGVMKGLSRSLSVDDTKVAMLSALKAALLALPKPDHVGQIADTITGEAAPLDTNNCACNLHHAHVVVRAAIAKGVQS